MTSKAFSNVKLAFSCSLYVPRGDAQKRPMIRQDGIAAAVRHMLSSRNGLWAAASGSYLRNHLRGNHGFVGESKGGPQL